VHIHGPGWVHGPTGHWGDHRLRIYIVGSLADHCAGNQSRFHGNVHVHPLARRSRSFPRYLTAGRGVELHRETERTTRLDENKSSVHRLSIDLQRPAVSTWVNPTLTADSTLLEILFDTLYQPFFVFSSLVFILVVAKEATKGSVTNFLERVSCVENNRLLAIVVFFVQACLHGSRRRR
jgi:hypothetical protein